MPAKTEHRKKKKEKEEPNWWLFTKAGEIIAVYTNRLLISVTSNWINEIIIIPKESNMIHFS